jgi:hypothetical protein
MAGSKTRFGFAGDGSEPPDSDESRAARTVMGHDIHLRLPSGFLPSKTPGAPTPVPPAPASSTPSAPVPAPIPSEITEKLAARRPGRPQKSRLARFIGRWTDSGRFVSSGLMGDSAEGLSDDVKLPRDPMGRYIVVVLAVALLTFLLTVMAVKVHRHFTQETAVPSTR